MWTSESLSLRRALNDRSTLTLLAADPEAISNRRSFIGAAPPDVPAALSASRSRAARKSASAAHMSLPHLC
jgi:hypothetical protein